jgi:cytochrome c oxidase subunit 2
MRGGGALAVAAVVLGCGAWSTPAWAGAPGEGGGQEPRAIEVVASQFAFTPSEIEVSVGESVRLLIQSDDVGHGVAIPSLGVDATIPPGGDPITIDFVAGEPGRHPIVCSLFCGDGHDRMTGMLTVVAAGEGGARPTGGGGQPPGEPDRVADLAVDVLEPDFNVIALPTTLRLPRNKFAFRLTHRFSRPINGGVTYGNLLEDFFGFDSPALIGLEFRYGLLPGTQVGVYRGNTKNIQIFSRQNILWQRGPRGIGLDAQVSVEGLDNLREEYSGSVAAILSKRLGGWASVYAEPTWVGNVDKPGRLHPSFDPDDLDDDDDDDNVFMVGLGTRLRVRPTVYLLGEYVPRLTGFDAGAHHLSFGIEKRAGGHTFQLNFSNSLGTTPAQLAQGGSKDDWFIGFNIARKFF